MEGRPTTDDRRPTTETGASSASAGAKHTVSDGGVLAQVLRQDVQALLRTLQGSGVEEIRLERSGRRIVLRRTWETTAPVSVEEAPAHADLSRLAIPGRTEVHAQVVGVFHRAREVDGPPLANEGDHVEVGKVLGVVETLGLATDVTAPIRGRLSEFVAHDGQPVEYGQLIAVVVPE